MKTDGHVLGIDVGWSTKRKSSAVCLLYWNASCVEWKIRRFRAIHEERVVAIQQTAGQHALAAVAIDGPLRRCFDEIGHYRSAERLLTHRGLRERIGKPGQSSSYNGRKLNQQANYSARLVDELCRVNSASSPVRIASRAIVEAFPTTFLGLMIDCPENIHHPRSKSDRYFEHLASVRRFDCLLADLLPDRTPACSPSSIKNHDDRAAFVCALTALCLAVEDYTAVGDDADGWIILPPRRYYADWAWNSLSLAVRADSKGGQLYFNSEPDQRRNDCTKSNDIG